MPIKVVISGATGRMGQTLVDLIADAPDFQLIGGIDKEAMSGADAERFGFTAIETAATASELLRAGDVLLDFSAVAGLQTLLAQRAHDLAGKAVVIGTTGLTEKVLEQLEQLARQSVVLTAANFSIAVNLMLALTEAAARVLGPDRYDVEIVEAHHKRKVDAPSGTALALGKAVAAGRGTSLDKARKDGRSGETGARPAGEIGIHALRGGEIVGEHRVHFIGARDRLELAHSAQDRALFADGALVAAKWVYGKPPGRYSMMEVLGLGDWGTG
jgi:4-hydroxy-tetrahydrodipicolinate reductase